MPTCKEVAKTLGSGERLTLRKTVSLAVHLFICRNCKNYFEQLKAIKAGFTKLIRQKMTVDKDFVSQVEDAALKAIHDRSSDNPE